MTFNHLFPSFVEVKKKKSDTTFIRTIEFFYNNNKNERDLKRKRNLLAVFGKQSREWRYHPSRKLQWALRMVLHSVH